MVRGDVLRKAAVLFLVLGILFCRGGVVFGQNSAVFRVVSIVPPPAQGGKKIIFVVRITNTGTESWVSGEYSVLVKIYDANKNYLDETDKIRQFKDVEPGELLTANIDFDIPAEYSGTYHYRVGIEFEKETLFSHYFILRVLPFAPVPEFKKWTGNVQVGYQDSQAVEPTTSMNLRVVNLLPRGRYLKFSSSGQSSPAVNPELSNFLVSYHSKKLELSAGDFTTGLSELTLGRSRGIKVESTLGKVSLAALAASPQKLAKTNDEKLSLYEEYFYGFGGSTNLASNLVLGGNYVQGKDGQNSIASLEAEFALSPQITLSGEYGWSSYEGEEIELERKRGNAFRIAASAYLERLALDGSYQKSGSNFFSIASAALLNSQEEGDLSLTYSFTDYISGTLYYNRCHENLSQQNGIFRYSLANASLSFFLPKLPSLTLSYDIFENFNNEDSEVAMDDTTDTFTVGISYPIKKVRLSISHSRSDYKDRTEFPSREAVVSNTYGISAPWGKYLVLSTHYGTSDTKDLIGLNTTKDRYVTLGMEYKIVPDKLSLSTQYKVGRNKDIEDTVNNRRITTTLRVSYYPTKKDVVQLGYVLTDEDNFVGASAPASDSKKVYLSSRYNLTKNQSLELRYDVINGGSPTGGTTSSQNQSVHLTYNYRF